MNRKYFTKERNALAMVGQLFFCTYLNKYSNQKSKQDLSNLDDKIFYNQLDFQKPCQTVLEHDYHLMEEGN